MLSMEIDNVIKALKKETEDKGVMEPVMLPSEVVTLQLLYSIADNLNEIRRSLESLDRKHRG